jgi:hypothetical protein
MKTPSRITIAIATLALGVAPATALAHGDPGTHGRSQSAPGHSTSGSAPSSKAKAYGKACQSESKKHVAGQKGTPFSTCVTDMAHLAGGSKTNPHAACSNESKKHVTGQKGTPYSDCVSAAAKLRGDSGSTPTDSSADSV